MARIASIVGGGRRVLHVHEMLSPSIERHEYDAAHVGGVRRVCSTRFFQGGKANCDELEKGDPDGGGGGVGGAAVARCRTPVGVPAFRPDCVFGVRLGGCPYTGRRCGVPTA